MRSYNLVFGLVDYIDYNQTFAREGLIWDGFMIKRKSFEHEREFRAIYWPDHTLEAEVKKLGGLWLEVSLPTLIEEIYVALALHVVTEFPEALPVSEALQVVEVVAVITRRHPAASRSYQKGPCGHLL